MELTGTFNSNINYKQTNKSSSLLNSLHH